MSTVISWPQLELQLVFCSSNFTSFPIFENPYPMDIHESPVTCTAYFADCPPDIIPVLYSIGAKHKKTGYSHKVIELNYFYSVRYCMYCIINPLTPLKLAIRYSEHNNSLNSLQRVCNSTLNTEPCLVVLLFACDYDPENRAIKVSMAFEILDKKHLNATNRI